MEKIESRVDSKISFSFKDVKQTAKLFLSSSKSCFLIVNPRNSSPKINISLTLIDFKKYLKIINYFFF